MPCKVLDPFAGAGTTGLAALRHGRDAVLIELNSEYCKIMEQRLAGEAIGTSRLDRRVAELSLQLPCRRLRWWRGEATRMSVVGAGFQV